MNVAVLPKRHARIRNGQSHEFLLQKGRVTSRWGSHYNTKASLSTPSPLMYLTSINLGGEEVNVYALYYKLQFGAPGHVARVCCQY